MSKIITTVNNISKYGFSYHGSSTLLATFGYLDLDDEVQESDLPKRMEDISAVSDIDSGDYDPVGLIFWNYISTFWSHLSSKDRDVFENMWDGMTKASYSLYVKAKRFFDLTHPENTHTKIIENYYDILIGPLNSIPTSLDPTFKNPSYIIRPVDKILVEPTYENEEPIYSDLIEIEKNDYYKIRDIGVGQYVVIKINDSESVDKVFKISNLLSSEEIGDRYYPADPALKYMIKIDGDLSYIKDRQFTIYLTTGLSYAVDKYITTLPVLRSFISEQYGTPFYEGLDYRFYNSTIEFFGDIFLNGNLEPNTYLYCPKASALEYMLYEMYGTLVSMSNWEDYGHDAISGKAAINALMLSIQNGSDIVHSNKALNAYYGMPIAPDDAVVMGLYESYGYEVIEKADYTIRLKLKEGSSMHPFIQENTILLVDGKAEVRIHTIIDRDTGTVVLYDSKNVDVGDLCYVKLTNRYPINIFQKETESENPRVDIKNKYDAKKIQHLVDIINEASNGNQYPEMLVYGCETLSYNYNGIYHITKAEKIVNNISLTLYKKLDTDDFIYNDFVGRDDTKVHGGFVHIPWPTHKFLYLYLKSKQYCKMYIDSPLDTIFESGDEVKKYDVLTRNVSVLTSKMFPNWVEYDHFRRYNGLNIESNHLELTSIMPGINFGEYFPESILLK